MTISKRGVPARKENKIVGADGEEYTQRHIDINKPGERPRTPGPRVRVYNKSRARIHCSDCILDAEDYGDIAQADLEHPNIANNVIVSK